MKKTLPIPEDIVEYLEYNENTGDLTRIKRVGKGGRGTVGIIKGTLLPSGHYQCRFKGTTYHMHRIAWFLKTGRQPPNEIDHIDTDGTNNKWANLRDAGNQNKHNQGKYKNNTSGYKGVTWNSRANKWVASIRLKNKPIHLGVFDIPELAHLAYCEAADLYHKEFANYG